jgi:LuxR family maltose regulon positive regulatory protein
MKRSSPHVQGALHVPKIAHHRLAWSVTHHTYQVEVPGDHALLDIEPESSTWFDWLDHLFSFAFWGQGGHYTARKERRPRGEAYWYAYAGRGKKLTKKYLGKTSALTLRRLEHVAEELAAARESALDMQPPQKASYETVPPTSPFPVAQTFVQQDLIERLAPRAEPNNRRDPLLATKLYVPRPRTLLVRRPQLTLRLQQGMERALTLVSAPAGFGKTTLLSQWLAEWRTPVAWLSLEVEDNETVRFFSYLLAAVQTLYPALGTVVGALLEAPQPAPLEHLLPLLLNDICERSTGDFALVLDDYHVIEAEAIHQGMAFLLEHLPPQMHLVLATRADPPFPLWRLRARGQLTEVRAGELRFDADEAARFLHVVMGLDLSAPALAVLERRTEGWVAGLQFAALSLQGRTDSAAFLSGFTGSHRFVLDYLSEEVLSRQPASVQSFLLSTSILERLSGPLCDAVTEQQESQAMLETLEQANLFVVALDDERRWYRYHHLFAEALRNRLQQTAPRLVFGLHLRASAWYEQQGMFVEAVQHALAASDIECVVRLIEHHGTTLIFKNQYRLLLDWIQALPEALIRAHPLLALVSALTLIYTWQFDKASALLAEAEGWIQANTQAKPSGLIAGYLAQCRAELSNLDAGDLASAITWARRALSLLPETQETAPLRAAAFMYIARAYQVSGDVTSESERQVLTMAEASAASGLFGQMRGLAQLVWLRQMQGRLSDVIVTWEQGLPVAPEQEEFRYLALNVGYYFTVAAVLCERNQLEAAERFVASGMDAFEQTGAELRSPLLAYTVLARLHQACGKYDQAHAALDAFTRLCDTRYFPRHTKAIGAAERAHIAAVRAHIELARGNLPAALGWAEASGLSCDDAELPYSREREYLTLARVYIAAGREDPGDPFLADALRLLDRLLEDARTKARMSSVLEILVVQALALQAQGNTTKALTTLECALAQAEPEGYIRLFVDEGGPMLTLLQKARARGILPDYVATLLSAFGEQHTSPVAQAQSPLVEPLTPREREVLQLLSAGASNGEIAHRLVVSIGTVKKHVSNICGKLGVQSRTQAIAQARILHLL